LFSKLEEADLDLQFVLLHVVLFRGSLFFSVHGFDIERKFWYSVFNPSNWWRKLTGSSKCFFLLCCIFVWGKLKIDVRLLMGSLRSLTWFLKVLKYEKGWKIDSLTFHTPHKMIKGIAIFKVFSRCFKNNWNFKDWIWNRNEYSTSFSLMHGVHFLYWSLKFYFYFLVLVSWGFIFWFKTLFVYISASGFERKG